MRSGSRVQRSAYQGPKSKASRLRSWAVIILRNRGDLLGFVEAPDVNAAEAAAVKAFDLNEHQRSRLLLRERL
jgi:hypothetical protein